MNTENLNDNHLNDSPVFKPDLSVFYPNKQELYRKETASHVITIKRLMVAATLMLTIGIIWWLTAEEPQQQPVASVTPVQSNASFEKDEPKEIKKEIIIEKPTLAQQAKINIKKVQASLPVVTPREIVSSNKGQEELLAKENAQDEVISQAIDRPRSNFSEEALQSAQLIAKEATEHKQQQEVKATVNVPISVSDEKKRPFRGLVRKLSRTILGEGESLGDEDIVRVANFKIPVSNQ